MRTKLSDKYQTERENVFNIIIDILCLKDDKTFLLYDLDNDIEKQNKIIEMKKVIEAKEVPELNKYCEKCLYLDTGKQFI